MQSTLVFRGLVGCTYTSAIRTLTIQKYIIRVRPPRSPSETPRAMARVFRDDDELDDGGLGDEEPDEVLDADNDVENDDEGKPSSSITV
jgi:hypothetical protein